ELHKGVQGTAGHPLVQTLFESGPAQSAPESAWGDLVHGAAALAVSESRPSTVAEQLERYLLFCRPAARLEASLFGAADVEHTAQTHAAHLALNQMLLPRRRQRQPWPMDLVARFGVSPAQENADASTVSGFIRDHAGQLSMILTRNARCSLYRAAAGVSRSI